jgi:hypothetical protein
MNDPGRRRKRRHRRNDPDPRRRARRHRRNEPAAGLRGFTRGIVPAAGAAIGVTIGKAGARAVPKLVGMAPTGFLGLLTQTLSGTVVAGVVHMFAPGFARNMLVGTFENLYESLARTPVNIGGQPKPIPILGTALSDHAELYRLSGYAAPRAIGAYSRPVPRAGAVGRQMGRQPSGRLVYVA